MTSTDRRQRTIPSNVNRHSELLGSASQQAISSNEDQEANTDANNGVPTAPKPAVLFIPEYLTSEQVEQFYGIRGLGVRRCRGTGPPFAKLGTARGSKVLYARVAIEQWLAAQTFPHTQAHSAAVARAATLP
jgi:hypothetical protein